MALIKMEQTKNELRSGLATSSTMASLKCLLGSDNPNAAIQLVKGPDKPQSNAPKVKPTSTGPQTATVSRAKKVQPVAIHEGTRPDLTGREKYALATETVNSCLKVLSDSLKSSVDSRVTSTVPKADATSCRPGYVLQPTSGNSTPSRLPTSKSGITGSSASENHSEPATHTERIAECARLAFSLLRNADPQKLGVREMPKLQLETGLLALVSKLIAHGLQRMAIQELRLFKSRQEAALSSQASVKTTKARSTNPRESIEKETLASLLNLRIGLDQDLGGLQLAITYQQHVLKIITASRKPPVIEEALQYLRIENPNSLANLLVQQAKLDPNCAKSAKQLDALSHSILSLCPSVSSAADDGAKDPQQCPSPKTVFELQVTALRMRKLWWRMANHEADTLKELLDPFVKCAAAFQRRCSIKSKDRQAYDQMAGSYRSLGPFKSAMHSSALSDFHSVVISEAERAGLRQEALQWTETMTENCSSLESNHARRLTASSRKVAILIQQRCSTDTIGTGELAELLDRSLTGNGTDYDLLLAALADLAQAIYSNSENEVDGTARLGLVPRIAAFALRYARSYPGKNMHYLQIIMDTAMRLSKSTEDLLTWITDEAANLYVQAGTLRKVADVASSRPLGEAWAASSSGVSLSRIIRALLLRHVRSESLNTAALGFDLEQLQTAENGMLLEWQLKYAVELCSRTKYHNALRKLLPELLKRLSKVFAAAEFPLRRARVATTVFRLRESYPELLPPHNFKTWHDSFELEESKLQSDHGLRSYFRDVQAKLAGARMLSDGRPTSEDLRPSLSAWEQIVISAHSKQSLRDRIDEPEALAVQLDSLVSYFGMLGDDVAALRTRRLRMDLSSLLGLASPEICAGLVDLSMRYLRVGHSEKAGDMLGQAHVLFGSKEITIVIRLQYQLAYAEYLLARDNVDKCRIALEEARTARLSCPPQKICREDRRTYELLHARGWLIQSKYSLDSGLRHEALAAAKQSLRVLNSIWSSLERSLEGPAVEPKITMDPADSHDSRVSSLTQGVSKLQLQPTGFKTASGTVVSSTKGAAFWQVSPLLCKALLHLSDMFVHHGLFSEANYYSERAIEIAQSVGSSLLLSRIRSHRCKLLVLADRLGDAELCLSKDAACHDADVSLTSMERLLAEAGIREREGSLKAAQSLYEKATHVIENLSHDDNFAKLEWFDNKAIISQPAASTLVETTANDHQSNATGAQSVVKAGRIKQPAEQRVSRMTSKPVKKTITPNPGANQSSHSASRKPFYLLANLKAKVLLGHACIALRLGEDIQQTLAEIEKLDASVASSRQQSNIQYRHLMQKALAALAKDVTLNILTESTLSLPAISDAGQRVRHDQSIKKTGPKTKALIRNAKATAKTTTTEDADVRLEDLLLAARNSLVNHQSARTPSCGTTQTHEHYASLSNVTMFLSAMSQSEALSVCPAGGSIAIDLPRIKALEFEQGAIAVDATQGDHIDTLSWPNTYQQVSPTDTLSAKEFQETFIDIIPGTWIAVSLCLSEDASELYVARYHAGQSPLILRLPFSRHKPDEVEDEAFDYHKGKAELQDIVKLSNYTCHSTGSLEAKGAKTNWWSEREALDRRLHELLINIENIWFGGFRGVLSPYDRDVELLLRFRKTFESILNRYLPSRKAGKGKAGDLVLDDNILDLFIGLGQDHNGTMDLDEPLSDLLYFVVDMLQFSGERNAYDEVDFDGMAVDVLDALRTYHDASSGLDSDAQHLVLVLDRRLHAFPWESLPCLENVSVSRVGSMLSLRERITAMRSSKQGLSTQGLPNGGHDCHVVRRTSGTYILNPSSDLSATQKSLGPSLSSLVGQGSTQWTAIVNEAPSEDRFSSALTGTSMLLYFGHGAGSQYIRPRSVKRLDQCSDVVWLMGCSSGAVSEYGDLEPSAVPLSYLLAGHSGVNGSDGDGKLEKNDKGCFAVVATLWDVTDKDIDRFSLATGEAWGLWPSSEQSKLPAKTPRKREIVVNPSTPQQVPKAPRTPKVLKTPAPSKTPARSRSTADRKDGKKASLVEAVMRSRDACYLRYLNGAAPVVYGIPVWLSD